MCAQSSVVVALVAVLAVVGPLADAASIRGTSRSLTSTMRAGPFSLLHEGRCVGTPGCRAVQTAEECNQGIQSLKSMGSLETAAQAAQREAWAEGSQAEFDAEWLVTATADVCSPTTVKNEAGEDELMSNSVDCDTTPSGCTYAPLYPRKRAFFNSWEKSTAADATTSRNVVCVCDGESYNRERPKSLDTCGTLELKNSMFDIISVNEEGETRKEDEQGKAVVQAEATFAELHCSYGHSFTGKRNGFEALTIQCDAATHKHTITETESGRSLNEIPMCAPNRCTLDALKENVNRESHGLWMASAQGPGKELLANPAAVVAHGDMVRGVVCNRGFSLGGGLPTAFNQAFELECRDGGLYLSVGQPDDGIHLSPETSEFRGAECTPIKCPQTAPIFADSRARTSGEDSYTGRREDTFTFECEEGFVLCTDLEEGVTCPAEHQVPDKRTLCGDEGKWMGQDEAPLEVPVEALTCRPKACPVRQVSENEAGGMASPTIESKPEVYVFTPNKDERALRLVSVQCGEKFSTDGDRDGPKNIDLACMPSGNMEVLVSGKSVGAPPEGDLCKPIGCQAVALVRHHMFGHDAPVADESQSVAHGETVDLDCEKGTSYDGLGWRSADPERWTQKELTTSNYKRQLVCDHGEYRCQSGWCEYLTTGGSHHNLECLEVKCDTPTGDALASSWYVDPTTMDKPWLTVADARPNTFLTGFELALTCEAGYKTPAEQEACTFISTCGSEWEGSAEAFSGWEPALSKCQLDTEYCPEVNNAEMDKINVAHPEVAPGRSRNDKRPLHCVKGFTLSNVDPAKPTLQIQSCNTGEGCKGMWKGALKPCEPVQCTNPPDPEPMNALEFTGECGEAGARCAEYDQEIEYKCQDGFRWAPMTDGEQPEALPADAPASMFMRCDEKGDFSITRPEHFTLKQGLMPRCITLFCADAGKDPMDILTASLDLEKHYVDLLKLTYKWEGPSDGFGGRKFDEGYKKLSCRAGGVHYRMKCGKDGTFALEDPTGGLSSLKEKTSELLSTCGYQMRVKPAERARVIPSNLCMTRVESSVVVAECTNALETMWWFDNVGGDCERVLKSGVASEHVWKYCGQVRSLKPGTDGKSKCLAPPEVDGRGPPHATDCADVEAKPFVWMLEDGGTLRLDHNDPEVFRKFLYLSAATEKHEAEQAEEHQQAEWRIEGDDYFNMATEHGWAAVKHSEETVIVE